MMNRRKLTNAQVAALRAEYDPSIVSARDLARRYGISQGYVYSLVLGHDRKSISMSDDVGHPCSREHREGLSNSDSLSPGNRTVQ